MRMTEVSAKTRKDAIQKALDQLGVELHEVNIEILDEGSRGLFGLGARDVRVRVTAEGLPDVAPASPEKPVARDRRPGRRDRPARSPRSEHAGRSQRAQQGRQERRDRPQRTARSESREPAPQSERRPPADKPARRDRERPAVPESRRPEERAPRRGPGEGAATCDEATLKKNERTGAEAASLLHEMIRLMGLESEISSEAHPDGSILLKVQSPDSAILIGRKGRNLNAMQYLINRMTMTAENSETVERMTVDIEGYLDRRRANLEEMARRMARKVKDTGKEVRLQPLNPQERRVVHLTLQEDPDVRTFSLGSAALRSVVIAPKDNPQKSADDRPRRSRSGMRRGRGPRHNGPGRHRQDEDLRGGPHSEAGESVEGAVPES